MSQVTSSFMTQILTAELPLISVISLIMLGIVCVSTVELLQEAWELVYTRQGTGIDALMGQ